jgi:hypothetical protein
MRMEGPAMKKRTCLLLCFLLCGMALSSISRGEANTVELQTDYFKAFRLKGDPTPYLLFFMIFSAERSGVQGTQHPGDRVRPIGGTPAKSTGTGHPLSGSDRLYPGF